MVLDELPPNPSSLMRSNDIKRVESGANRLRMRQRTAAQKGMTLEQYERWMVDEPQRRRRIKAAATTYSTTFALRVSVNADRAELLRLRQKAEHSAKMLALYHADPDNWSTRKKRRRLFERDGWKCRVCGVTVSDELPKGHAKRAVAMHIVAKATGGEWTDENMATGCHRCNVADGVNKIPIQTALL